MKKAYFLLLFLLPFSMGLHAQGICGSNFWDGFESGSYSPTWSIGTGLTSASVLNTGAAVGNYCLTASGGTSTHLTGLSTTIPSCTPTYASWWIKPTGALSGNYVVLGNASVTANNCVAFCYFVGSASQIRFVSSITMNYNVVTGQWYHIEMKNINFTTHTFDIYVDGLLQASNFPFRNSTQNDISRIHLYNFNSTVAYWDDIRIGAMNVINFHPTVSDPNCTGDSTGSIQLNPSGATPSINYVWSDGSTASSLSNIPSGNYSITLSDAVGCLVDTSITLTDPPLLTWSAATTDANCFGSNDGGIDLSPAGGTPGYSYLWSNGDSVQDPLNLVAGTYSLTLTDTLGCTGIDSFTIAEPPALAISDSLTMVSCFGDSNGAAFVNLSGGSPGYSILWSTGDTMPNISGLPAGTYQMQVNDTHGCADSLSVIITQPDPLLWTDSLVSPLCHGGLDGAIYIQPFGGTPGYFYAWANGDTSQNLLGLGAGAYLLTLTDANGCSAMDSMTISEPAALTLSGIVADDIGGTGTGAVDITVGGGTPGYLFNWSNGATTQDLANLTQGTYSVVITDSNGCTIQDSFQVNFVVSVGPGWENSQLRTYPNPFSDHFTVAFDMPISGRVSLELVDMQGRILEKSREIQGAGGAAIQVEWTLQEVPAGVYFLRVFSQEGISVIKLEKF